MRFYRIVGGVVLASAAWIVPCPALDKPTGAPLVMSDIETEQPVPLAVLSPDSRTASCALVKLHWSPSATVTSQDDAISFTLDVAPDSPGAAIFTAQLWSASLASSLAWQKPWQGAHWKILQTPATDGTGIDAALAVGMIATSARRPYPKDTLVIGNLHPDSSLGAVSRLSERLDAAAKAGINRVIIPKVQLFETDSSGNLVNIMRHASDLHLECIPVDNIVEAIEATMNDPMPDPPVITESPKYTPGVASYIDGFAQREQAEATNGLQFAPKEAEIAHYPPRQAAIWRQVYAEINEGQEAYHGGEVYVAYRLLERANSRMRGMNALAGQVPTSFDVKEALATADDLRAQLHTMMTPPPIDHAELQSAMLIAEMADWAYDINALLEGAELVTKQSFSQRSDATAAQRDHARENILSANEEAKYLLNGADFFTGLLPRLGDANQLPANTNAANLLPQLIPAQLATAEIFTTGIRPRANELREGLLFDPRLVAYVSVLREAKAAWDSHQRKKLTISTAVSATDPTAAATAAATQPNQTNSAPVGFDFGSAYAPPHTVVESTATSSQQLSDVAQCLIWVNTDCEIEALDEKYLRLSGTVDPATREWHLKDRAPLDALLQLAENGANQGIAFAQEAEVDPSIFSMIMERAGYLRHHGDDASALDGLRNYWRCALLGNMCWQLSHTRKAAAVDLSAEPGAKKDSKKSGKAAKNKDETAKDKSSEEAKDKTAPSNADTVVAVATDPTNVVVVPIPPDPVVIPAGAHDDAAATNTDITNAATNTVVTPAPVAPAETNGGAAETVPTPTPPAAAPTHEVHAYPRALPVDLNATNDAPPATAPTAAPAPETGDSTIPVAPMAAPFKDDVYTGGDAGGAAVAKPVSPATNAPSTTP